MYSIDSLTLISGIDVPIPEIGVNIHQPTIREIAYIGEKSFYEAAQTIIIQKEDFINGLENITQEDKIALSQMSNFEIFLKLIEANSLSSTKVQMLLSLLFPDFNSSIEERFIFLVNPKEQKNILINDSNFEILQEVITTILCLQSGNTKEEFNPQGDRAREIAEKIKRGRERAARLKGEKRQQSSFLSKYISGLGIGTNTLNIHNVLDLTIYQLLNQLERYGLYTQYNISIQAKMAGAKDVEDVDWLKDIENK